MSAFAGMTPSDLQQRGKRVKQVEVAVIGTGWCGGIRAETLSRSALVDRFTRYLSEPPMAYLTGWRLRLAAEALTSTPKGVADIAADVGYDSEAAFNRAFKRVFGVPPARYRRNRRDPGISPGS